MLETGWSLTAVLDPGTVVLGFVLVEGVIVGLIAVRVWERDRIYTCGWEWDWDLRESA
jgi:hypothetical protein